MEIVGNHLQSINRLNVSITHIYPTNSELDIGIQRSDGLPDPRFAQFHQVPMTGTDLLQFVSDLKTLTWELSPSSGLEFKSRSNAGDYLIELFSVMRQEQAIACFVKIVGGQAH